MKRHRTFSAFRNHACLRLGSSSMHAWHQLHSLVTGGGLLLTLFQFATSPSYFLWLVFYVIDYAMQSFPPKSGILNHCPPPPPQEPRNINQSATSARFFDLIVDHVRPANIAAATNEMWTEYFIAEQETTGVENLKGATSNKRLRFTVLNCFMVIVSWAHCFFRYWFCVAISKSRKFITICLLTLT